MKKENGQIVLILILVITVALAIGLSVIQRSLTNISTSTTLEQSSRAFSAAEAGIERAIQSDTGITSRIDLGNNASIEQVAVRDVPATGQALEYPPISKEEFAHVWLASPVDLSNAYSTSALYVYWGNQVVSSADVPALQLTIIYQDTASAFRSKKLFYDPDPIRRDINKFDEPGGCPSNSTKTSLSPETDKTFYSCVRIDVSSANLLNLDKLMVLRARILYSSTSQAFAVAPVGPCSLPIICTLPKQGRVFTSIGASGPTYRRVQLFQEDKVVPFFFDYAIFSTGELSK